MRGTLEGGILPKGERNERKCLMSVAKPHEDNPGK